MIINGWQKVSLLDYPEKIVTTIFTPLCNFRCPFCHNSDLVFGQTDIEYSEDDILNYIDMRKNILDGICISGGEPTLQKDLIDFIKKLKSLNILIKLDTNGYKPDVLEELLNNKLLDYVAMDIKNSKNKYFKTCDIKNNNINKIEKSIKLLMNSNIDYEFRTTIIKEFHDKEDIHKIGNWIKGCKNYYMQQYVPSETEIKGGFTPYTRENLYNFKNILNEYIDNVTIRGL